MAGSLEIWNLAGSEIVRLEGDRVTIGKAPSNDIAIASDSAMSRMHAVLERLSAGWVLRDLSSRNGTYVNGERIWAERPLRNGDDIQLGKTRIYYHADKPEQLTATEAPEDAPELTRREREVMVALCRPLLAGDAFSEPATVREMAEELVVTNAAIKQHLGRLYDKFRIFEQEGESRRAKLANEAMRRGAVSRADLLDRPR
jgi:ATP/maltotriose-dependent transcriptional regulator MalT